MRRLLHNADMSTWKFVHADINLDGTNIFLRRAAAASGAGAGVWLAPACHPPTYPSLYLGILWYARRYTLHTLHICITNSYSYSAAYDTIHMVHTILCFKGYTLHTPAFLTILARHPGHSCVTPCPSAQASPKHNFREEAIN